LRSCCQSKPVVNSYREETWRSSLERQIALYASRTVSISNTTSVLQRMVTLELAAISHRVVITQVISAHSTQQRNLQLSSTGHVLVTKKYVASTRMLRLIGMVILCQSNQYHRQSTCSATESSASTKSSGQLRLATMINSSLKV